MANLPHQVQSDLELNPLGLKKRLVLVCADPDHKPTLKEKDAKVVKIRSGSGSGVSGAVRWFCEEKTGESHSVLWLQRDHQGKMVKATQSRIKALGGAVASVLLVIDVEHCRLTLTSEVMKLVDDLRRYHLPIRALVFSHNVLPADTPLRQHLCQHLDPERELNFLPKGGSSFTPRGETRTNTAHVFRRAVRELQKGW